MSINHIKLARLDNFPYTPAAMTTILFRLDIKKWLSAFIANNDNDADIGCPIKTNTQKGGRVKQAKTSVLL